MRQVTVAKAHRWQVTGRGVLGMKARARRLDPWVGAQDSIGAADPEASISGFPLIPRYLAADVMVARRCRDRGFGVS